jgi:hypothetical protein
MQLGRSCPAIPALNSGLTVSAEPCVVGSVYQPQLPACGHLFCAAAYKLEDLLPSARGAQCPVIILQLRRSDRIASTLINVLQHYEAQLRARGGKHELAGVSPCVKEQPDVTETASDVLGDESILLATENIGEATRLTLEAAQVWLEREAEEPSPAESSATSLPTARREWQSRDAVALQDCHSSVTQTLQSVAVGCDGSQAGAAIHRGRGNRWKITKQSLCLQRFRIDKDGGRVGLAAWFDSIGR